ncbi:MAG: U32 family peptidase [Firmicutes bacterium]|nr:U32 family peptidase [Bacillota bacterium]
MKRRPEILAPVGGEQQLKAAVRCGADAVYFGLQDFNARRSADNFSGEALPKTMDYCHERGVKVYITVNTLIKEGELSAVKRAADTACENRADGLIVQDLAVAEYAKKRWPDVPLIASTQMAVHNAEGTLMLKEMGFSRAVLARELSLSEIREIYEKTGMELESFVHGAHCMSVSGLCYISSIIGGRSGNRGLCAQPCRLDCSVCGRDHALSLKDLSYIKHIEELANAGVCSLKIEGRMKRPEYVAASVSACRAVLDGREPDMEALRAVFSRSGFTDGYLTGKRDLSMFGYRTKEDVTAASDVLKDLAALYEKEPQNIPVDMVLTAEEGKPSVLSVSCGEISVRAEGAVPQAARTLPITEEYAQRSLSKTGGTPYYLRSLKLIAGEGLMLPSSQLNELRRSALESLAEARIKEFEKRPHMPLKAPETPSEAPKPGKGETALWTRFESPDQLFSGCPETVILPLHRLAEDPGCADRARELGAKTIMAEIPPVVWPSGMERVRRQLLKIKELNITDAYVENLGGLRLSKEYDMAAHGGMFLNITNSEALLRYSGLGLKDCLLSFELPFKDMEETLSGADEKGAVPCGLVVYGYLPLMKFRACPAKGRNGCGRCSGINKLTDRKGEEFTVICREKQYSEILNCVPLYAGDRRRPHADHELLYFTVESSDTCRKIKEALIEGLPIDGRRTAGLYLRDLL